MSDKALNDKVLKGLRAQYSADRTENVIQQATSMFQETQHRNGSRNSNTPEVYELFEGGWIDRALEFLGMGRWAIGRPKPGNGNGNSTRSQPRILRAFSHKSQTAHAHVNVDSTQQTVTVTVPAQPAQHNFPSLTEIFSAHLPSEFPEPKNFSDNAIEFRNVLVIGGQGSGKTVTTQRLAETLAEKYGHSKIRAYQETAGISKLLWLGTRYPSLVRLLAAEDMTLRKIPRDHLNSWFQVRHIIAQRTGWRKGLVIASSNVHTLFGLEKNLRTDFALMILLTVPTNPYDRSLLKRYFDKALLDMFEQKARKGDALIWDRYHNTGLWVKIDYPSENLLTDLTPYGQPRRLYRILFLDSLIVGCAIALAYVLWIMANLTWAILA